MNGEFGWRTAALGLALILLAGCGKDKAPANKPGTAQGEILPGSASDAMLPLDRVRSQAPLAGGDDARAGDADGGEPKTKDAKPGAD